MKSDDPLTHRLASLSMPPPDPAARERALYHAALALRGAAATEPALTQSWAIPPFRDAWKWARYAAVATLVTALGATIFRPKIARQPIAPSLPAESVVLGQIEALFGSQLDAVVEHPGVSPDIRLSPDAAAVGSLTQPVLIEFDRSGAKTTRVISYSGRTVCLTLTGRRICFEPLVTGQGEIILSGERFCWTSGQSLEGYRVTARPLPRT